MILGVVGTLGVFGSEVVETPPTTGTAVNKLLLKATMTGFQNKPKLTDTAGLLYSDRDSKVVITLDEGQDNAALYDGLIFEIFKLGEDLPVISKSLGSGIEVVDGNFEITLSALEMTFVGRYYFEAVVTKTTVANLLTGFISFSKSRTNPFGNSTLANLSLGGNC